MKTASHRLIHKLIGSALLGTLLIGLHTCQGATPPDFSSIQCGSNQLTLTVTFPNWARQITIESRTNLLAGAWAIEAAHVRTNTDTTFTFHIAKKGPRLFRARAHQTPAFQAAVSTGLNRIQSLYPGAVLYEVQSAPDSPTRDPWDIKFCKIICLNTPDNGTVMTETTTLYAPQFGPVEYSPFAWLGDWVIPWPVPIDLIEADALLRQAGYTGAYRSVGLRHPVYPGLDQPYYIFGMEDVGFVFVGVNDKNVFLAH